MFRSFGRKRGGPYTAFSAQNLGKLTVRETRVIYWVERGQFDLSINVKEQLFNENVGGYFLSKRLNVGFERTPARRFFLRRLSVLESTATFNIGFAPTYEKRFREREPVLLASIRQPEIRLVLKDYSFERIESSVEPKDPDIPF